MRRRVDVDRLVEMVRLHRSNVADRKAAKMLNMGPNQHRKAREAFIAAGLWDGDPEALPPAQALRALLPQRLPKQQVSSAETWRDAIVMFAARGGDAKIIHQRLMLDVPGFAASYDAVKRLLRTIRRSQPPDETQVVIPVENEPGEIAQVDFGYAGLVVDPTTREARKAWVFVMTLGFSRMFFARVVFDQTVATWMDLHVRAFEFFGAVPRTIVPDNLKAAVVRAAFGVDADIAAQRDYRDLARHYGFLIDPAPPADPESKGKVERTVQYVRPYLATRAPDADIVALNTGLDRWNREIASKRVHGTLRAVPAERLEVERAAMRPLPVARWTPTTWRERPVQRDAHVQFDGRMYSVPWTLIGKQVWVRATPDRVAILHDDVIVAEHDRRGSSYRSTADGHLPVGRAAFAQRSPQAWANRAAAIGPETAAWAEDLLTTPAVSELRVVQATILWLEGLPVERAEAVCRRAREYGIRKLGSMKNVAKLGLDRRTSVATPPEGGDPTAYARSISDLFSARVGGENVCH